MDTLKEKMILVENIMGCYQAFQFPKGINKDTTAIILRRLAQYPNEQELSTKEISDLLGMSQATLRKYLSFLVREELLDYELYYVKVGPPTKKFRLNRDSYSFIEKNSKKFIGA